MHKAHQIDHVNFENDTLILKVDGKSHQYPLAKISKRLLKATVKQRNKFQISPSGYGIHWPLIDEDLSIEGLLKLNSRLKRLQSALNN